MVQIRILSDHVANQIAAGEVIERPAAAVKELLENSLDAGATRIEIEFRKGGKSYLRVEDNGEGMDRDNALLSLERHATSKIREANDLLRVSSLGFRGEAIPSIASVSRFLMRTRPADQAEGTEILVQQGRLDRCRDVGMPPGTRMEVSQLFSSVPARRKFLKTDRTESSHILYLTRLYAVAHPGVAFTVIEDGREVFRSPACDSMRNRIGEIWGRSILKDLIPLERKTDAFHLYGFIGNPGLNRGTRHDLITVVNGRPVQSRLLSYGTIEAYHTYVPKGRYPVAFLFLEISPDAVDVNIHPSKREIRFREEGDLRFHLLDTVEGLLRGSGDRSSPPMDPAGSSPIALSPAPSTGPSPLPALGSPPERQTPPPPQTPLPARPDAPSPGTGTETEPPLPYRFIGLLSRNSAIFRHPEGLAVLHFRAADERIRFEEMELVSGKGPHPSQELLLPIPFEVDALRDAVIAENRPFFEGCGFRLAGFGRHFYRIEAIPAWLDPDLAETFLRDTIDGIRAGDISTRDNRLAHARMASLAVRSAWSRRDSMDEAGARRLLKRLLQCRNPHTCPAGKPTLIQWDVRDMESRFQRSVRDPSF